MQGYVPRYHRVYLLDDHDIVRQGLRDLLVRARDVDVVGDSGTVRGAAEEILRLEVDVMLLDLQLPDGSGIEVCRAVRSVKPNVSGLLLTAAGDAEASAAAVLAGAAGYLVKLTRTSDIVASIRSLRPGSSLLDADGVQRAVALLRSVAKSLRPQVTEDERRVLELVLEGRTDSEILDGWETSDGRPEPDLAAFTARMTEALLRASPGEGGAVAIDVPTDRTEGPSARMRVGAGDLPSVAPVG